MFAGVPGSLKHHSSNMTGFRGLNNVIIFVSPSLAYLPWVGGGEELMGAQPKTVAVCLGRKVGVKRNTAGRLSPPCGKNGLWQQ